MPPADSGYPTYSAAAATGPDLVPVRRALLSASDKTGLVEFAGALQREFGVELISTGGTAKLLRETGLKVADVSEVTGFPEMMDGRVKTLHPMVHGGLLAVRNEASHVAAMQQHGITAIDLLVVNLYPFEATVAKGDCTFAEAIENIDIGGPAMIRSAAKNHRSVCVVTDAIQYEKVLKHMRVNGGATPYQFRLDLAMWAYTRTAQYDAAIYPYLAGHYFKGKRAAASTASDANPSASAGALPFAAELEGLLPALTPILRKAQDLRYGENPHQRAAFYRAGGAAGKTQASSIATAQQLHGKELSYINILDADAAIELVREFGEAAAAVIKHTNPCGCGMSPPTAGSPSGNLAEAFDLAYAGDSVAAFGGIVALNRDVDEAAARRIVEGKRFLEVLIAPGYAPAALEILQGRWKDCRILSTGPLAAHAVGSGKPDDLHYRSVTGGMLVQQVDGAGFDRAACKVVSARQPTDAEWRDLTFIWLVTKHVKSNAVALAKDGQLLSAGAGQMSRVTASRLAVELARQNGHADKVAGCAAGSDAFFPFADGPEILAEAGIKALIQPGGSKKDQDTIDLCDRHGIALVHTGQRHFKH